MDETARQVLEKFLEDAHALHPGYMTVSGLLARLDEAGYQITKKPT